MRQAELCTGLLVANDCWDRLFNLVIQIVGAPNADSARPMNQVGRAAGPRESFIMVCVVGQIQGGDPSG